MRNCKMTIFYRDFQKKMFCSFQYVQLARTLKFYGYLVFKPCYTDYPHSDCPVLVAAGNKELNFRVQVGNVSLDLIRCS